MIKKKYKASRKDFKLLKKDVVGNSLFLLKFSEQKNSLFTFSVSKKIEKKAVKRNKIKRQSFIIFEKYINMIKTGLFLHFIFIRKPKSAEEIDKNVIDLLEKQKLWKK